STTVDGGLYLRHSLETGSKQIAGHLRLLERVTRQFSTLPYVPMFYDNELTARFHRKLDGYEPSR
ncbi:MAG: hypothetical protein AB1797_13695, partial [bacterium]